MLGAKDVAFPRLNLFPYYLYVIGALFAVLSITLGGGGYRLDVLHALFGTTTTTACRLMLWRVCPGVLVDSHGDEFHRRRFTNCGRRA